ncbi:MAG TPA: hypothetical protein VHB68_18815 [Steroidobacteraceae bacterium]|nr:hypothetical protein [Steroidobacteraceae bacterium]
MAARVIASWVVVSVLAGCSGAAAQHPTAAEPRAAAAGTAPDADAKADNTKKDDPVELTPEMAAQLGVTTAPAQAVTFAPTAQGLGMIVSHDVVAQVAADLETAAAAVKQSAAALERMKSLSQGPGALGIDALESAQKQSAADQAALALAHRKLTATLGLQFPGHGQDVNATLAALANGTVKLARVTFPPGTLSGGAPHGLRFFTFDAGEAGASWTASSVWAAPQDPTMPGNSYFALLKYTEIPEGARLQVLPIGEPGASGVLIPSSAVVIADGKYWCYVKKDDGFVRVPIDVERPLAAGYFVNAGAVSAGDRIVTAAAGLLLARQMAPAAAAED